MIVIIDNYDSFTYNLYQLIAKEVEDVQVYRNDKITVAELERLQPEAIIISPGPGAPKDAGICIELIQKLAPKIPIFGVCLGHQAITEAFGGKVVGCHEIVHGKSTHVFHKREGIFKDLSLPFLAGRYHSLVAEKASFPEELEMIAENETGIVMALKHKEYPCYGVQFHPESILTPEGGKIIVNFLKLCLTKAEAKAC